MIIVRVLANLIQLMLGDAYVASDWVSIARRIAPFILLDRNDLIVFSASSDSAIFVPINFILQQQLSRMRSFLYEVINTHNARRLVRCAKLYALSFQPAVTKLHYELLIAHYYSQGLLLHIFALRH